MGGVVCLGGKGVFGGMAVSAMVFFSTSGIPSVNITKVSF